MVSGNDNNNQGNPGRLQSSSVERIKKQIEEGMKKGIEKEIGSEGTLKNIAKSEPVKDLKEEILKRAEKERERMEYKGVTDYQTKKTLKEEYEDDKIRIKDVSARQAAAIKLKKESEREAEKEVNKRLKEMNVMQGSRIKRRIASKVMGKVTSEMAYRIAQKMSEAANKGGIYAIVIILLTLFMALYTDVIDVLVEIFALIIAFLGIVSVAGIPIGVIVGAIGIIAWVSNFFVSLTILFFWMFTLGGGHKKWFWKIVIRLAFGLLIAESIPYLDLLPIATFMVCWNWHDFAKERKKANKNLAEFKTEFYQTGRVSKKHAKSYA